MVKHHSQQMALLQPQRVLRRFGWMHLEAVGPVAQVWQTMALVAVVVELVIGFSGTVLQLYRSLHTQSPSVLGALLYLGTMAMVVERLVLVRCFPLPVEVGG